MFANGTLEKSWGAAKAPHRKVRSTLTPFTQGAPRVGFTRGVCNLTVAIHGVSE